MLRKFIKRLKRPGGNLLEINRRRRRLRRRIGVLRRRIIIGIIKIGIGIRTGRKTRIGMRTGTGSIGSKKGSRIKLIILILNVNLMNIMNNMSILIPTQTANTQCPNSQNNPKPTKHPQSTSPSPPIQPTPTTLTPTPCLTPTPKSQTDQPQT